MVRPSRDTVRCGTQRTRRPLTGQIHVGVVRCGPFTTRGGYMGTRRTARRSTLVVCVVTLLLAALTFGATSRQSSSSTTQQNSSSTTQQGVTKDSIKIGIPL